MEACLQPQVSCRFKKDNHQVEKERYWRNLKKSKKKKPSQKNVRIVYNFLFVRVCLRAHTRVCVCVYV